MRISKSRPRRLALELDSAFLLNRCLLDRDHLTLHLSEFRRSLLVPADKERRRPENDDRRGSRQTIVRAFLILNAR